jgi:hypothetical protein
MKNYSYPRLGLRWSLRAYLVLFAIGLAGFSLTKRPRPWTPRVTATRVDISNASKHNIASVYNGGQVHASSWDHFRSHHPMYAIDEEPRPSLTEKWVSAVDDPAPWIEIRWPSPRTIQHVRVSHATWREPAMAPAAHYDLRCHRPNAPSQWHRVRNNADAIALHDIFCQGATGLSVHFQKLGNAGQVRIYEIAVVDEPR